MVQIDILIFLFCVMSCCHACWTDVSCRLHPLFYELITQCTLDTCPLITGTTDALAGLPFLLAVFTCSKMMSRLFLLALLALVGLASGFAPVNTPSVVGKFIGGGIGENREEKERGARKKFGWRRPRPSVVFSSRLLRRREVGEIGPKRIEDPLRLYLDNFYRLWRLAWWSQFVSTESRDFRVEPVFVGETKSVSQSV